jgi:ribose transport system permease protein
MTTPSNASPGLRDLVNRAGIGLALMRLVIFFSVTTEHFLTPNNITNILTQITINLILGVGMTFVTLIGGIDLSVGSILAFAAAIAGKAMT